jgi:hypothetical protein
MIWFGIETQGQNLELLNKQGAEGAAKARLRQRENIVLAPSPSSRAV